MSAEFRRILFESHRRDLQDIGFASEHTSTILCPICLNRKTVKELTDGHVWPKELRAKSAKGEATQYRVLLCRDCNSRAGTTIDKQMQLKEQVFEPNSKIDRKITILPIIQDNPIHLVARLKKPIESNSLTLIFDKDRNNPRLWARNNPKEQERFNLLMSNNRPYAFVIPPHKGLKLIQARAGWINAAYLLTFYAFGYRYILHPFLNEIRSHILDAMYKSPDTLSLDDSSTIYTAFICDDCYTDKPHISLHIPFNGTHIFLEISFLQYHVRLPMHGDQEYLYSLIHGSLTHAGIRTIDRDFTLCYDITCSKSQPHECTWDYLLGIPDGRVDIIKNDSENTQS